MRFPHEKKPDPLSLAVRAQAELLLRRRHPERGVPVAWVSSDSDPMAEPMEWAEQCTPIDSASLDASVRLDP